ncbi:MAG TPA: M48 family metalloprotease [Oscillatoriaceae cyanobacterium]
MTEAAALRAGMNPRMLWALAALALPVSLGLTFAFGTALMGWSGCRYLAPSVTALGAAGTLVLLGAMSASVIANVYRTRRARVLAEQASVEVEDSERLDRLGELAARIGIPPPALRALVLDAPLAFAVMTSEPTIVVSTWTFDKLDDPEWQAVVAHELAHLRRGDRLARWVGCWLLRSCSLLPGARGAWERLDAAAEAEADRVATLAVGDAQALASARQKFANACAPAAAESVVERFLKPWPLAAQFAFAGLGVVAVLPLLPFVVVPLCMHFCVR